MKKVIKGYVFLLLTPDDHSSKCAKYLCVSETVLASIFLERIFL
jgi:hypothetical protein